VSLHVRRGDYLDPGMEHVWGNLASDGYYERVVKAIGEDVVFLVMSDDIPWCRHSLDVHPAEYVNTDHCTALCLMTGCDVNVIANSTFSWWGAYLNRGGEVYAPSRWFGPAMTPPNDAQNDILPPEWRTIRVFGDVERPDRPALIDQLRRAAARVRGR
jgi:hypothetical protein